MVWFYRLENGNRYPVQIVRLDAASNDMSFIEDSLTRTAYFPLDPESENTVFNLEYAPYVIDTVYLPPPDDDEIDRIDTIWSQNEIERFSINYRRTQRVLTPDCGVEQTFSKLEIVESSVDSIFIPYSTISRLDTFNVKIYL